jgi:hypothetical protein
MGAIRTDRNISSAGVTVSNPEDALNELMPELKRKCDQIVVLAHMSMKLARELVEAAPGADFVVVGLQAQKSDSPFELEGARFMQPGNRGQYIADYRLSFGADGTLTDSVLTVVELGDKVPADATMALKLKEYKAAVEDIRKAEAAERAREREEARRAAETYKESCLGVEKSCVRCHKDKYDSWKETAHSHAFATLQQAFQSTNPECLRCHTTCQLDLKQDGSVEVPEHLRNVQCEACHGMGAEHARDGSYGAIAVETCLRCHDEANSPDFDLATYLPKVTH